MTKDRPAWAARKLLRAARSGTLATLAEGQPFASLVTPASAPDLGILLLLSELSEHTHHLRADPSCSVLVSGVAKNANPQTAPRVSVIGSAEVVQDEALKARYLAIHPYATRYADFGDFALWRIRPRAGLYVGGFGRAARLSVAELTPNPVAVGAISAAEAAILTHCNATDATALAAIAGRPGAWRVVAVDIDGCDLACAEQVLRLPWSAPVETPGDLQHEFLRLTGGEADRQTGPRARSAAASVPSSKTSSAPPIGTP